jgi:CheY-like chemotaxis protein
MAVGSLQDCAALRDRLGTPAVILLADLGRRMAPEDLDALGVRAVVRKPLRRRTLLDALAPARRSTPAHPATWPFAGRRILVAEDNAVNQRLVQALLEREGLRVDLASNGIEAVAAAGRVEYDLVLVDCLMPEMDGWEAARAIRRRAADEGRRIPILALTASLGDGDRERCREAGMDGVLAKPLRTEDLQNALAAHLAPLPDLDERTRDRLVADIGGEGVAGLVATWRSGILGDLQAAESAADPDARRRAAHTIKGAAANLGLVHLAAVAAQAETCIDDADRWQEALALLAAAVRRARLALDRLP